MTIRFVGGVTHTDAEWAPINDRLARYKASFQV
jgi:hypothetical protein